MIRLMRFLRTSFDCPKLAFELDRLMAEPEHLARVFATSLKQTLEISEKTLVKLIQNDPYIES